MYIEMEIRRKSAPLFHISSLSVSHSSLPPHFLSPSSSPDFILSMFRDCLHIIFIFILSSLSLT